MLAETTELCDVELTFMSYIHYLQCSASHIRRTKIFYIIMSVWNEIKAWFEISFAKIVLNFSLFIGCIYFLFPSLDFITEIAQSTSEYRLKPLVPNRFKGKTELSRTETLTSYLLKLQALSEVENNYTLHCLAMIMKVETMKLKSY